MKKINFFEKLWEHSRTLRRVGLVLVMCLITITQVWAWSFWGGKDYYVDTFAVNWSSVKIKYNSSSTVTVLSNIAGTSYYSVHYDNNWDGYDGFTFFDGTNWDSKTHQSTYERYDVHPSSYAVFAIKNETTASGEYKIGYWNDTKQAFANHRIYFDATPITGWGDKAYLRYGFDCVAHADPMTKFPGTANLWYIDVKRAYYEKYTVANAAGNTRGNTVYQPTNKCKPTGEYAITKSLDFSDTDINGGSSTILSFIPTSKHETTEDCDWWYYTKNTNTSIPTKTVTISSTTNGKIRVDYTNTSGTSTYWEGSGGTSLTVPQSAIITVKAIPNTGYYNSALTVAGDAFASGSTYTVTATTAIAATFARSYAFIEGRFRVYNAARNTRTSVGGQGSWVKNSTNIPMSFDGTNGRFELHTYSTPAELKAAFTGGEGDADPYFYIKTSTASNSISSGNDDGPAEYWATSTSSNGNKLLNAGTANKRAVSKTSDALTFVGNSSSNDEYVILYCDGSYVWYELEYTLEYSAGTGSGAAPASKTYYNKGSKATVASNTFTAPSGYHFHHWSGSDGNTYAASDKVTMNSNVTLTAIWALDYPTGYIYITDVMATPATKAGTTITATKNSANYKTALSSTFNTNRVGYEEWAMTTGSGNYNLAFSSALDLSSYSGGVDIDVWWGANDNNRPTYIKINGGSQQDLDEVTTSDDRNQVRKATYHTDVTSLSSVQVLGPSSSGNNIVWFRIGIKEAIVSTYSITYHCNSATSGCPSDASEQTALPDPLPSAPTKNGYTFGGWYTDNTLETAAVAGATLNDDVKLYAKWTCTTPTFDPNLSTTPVVKCKDDKQPKLTVAASANSGSISYQWYKNTANSTSSPIPVALTDSTSASMYPPTSATGTLYYFCKATNTTGSCTTYAYSNITPVTVTAPTAISSHPSNVTNGVVGSPSTLTVTATGTGTLTYQWYTCNSDGSSPSAISSATNASAITATLSITPASAGTTYYKCVVHSDCGSDQTSSVASILAKNNISPSLTYASTVAVGSTINPSLSGNTGSGSVSYALNDVTPAGSLTINSSTGAVTGVTAGGTATVTVTISATESYWGNTATSGTITVPYVITHSAPSNGSYTIKVGSADAVSTNANSLSGTSITLTATPSSGYVFDHWTTSGTSVTLSNANVSPATFTMPAGNVTVNAVFKATPNVYYYKDATHFTAPSTYKNPEGNTPGGSDGDNTALTTPWTINSGSITGLTSVVATNATYDKKDTHVNAYIKLQTGGDEDDNNLIFTVTEGYEATIKMKIGGYESNPTITLKPYTTSLGSAVSYTGTVGGVATTENNFNEITWSDLEAGVYVLNTTSKTAYISEIDVQTELVGYVITEGTHTNGSIAITDGSSAITSAAAGETVTLTATPNTGYNFTSWTIKKTEDGSDVTASVSLSGKASATFTMPAYGVTIDATFTAINYRVKWSSANHARYTIQAEGGAATDGSVYANYGQMITLATTSVDDGYHLATWGVTKTDGGAAVDMATANTFVMPAEDVTVRPIFGKYYTVTFNSNGGSTTPSAQTQTAVGQELTMPAAPEYDDHTFVCWMIGGTTVSAGGSYAPPADVTAYAIWKEDCAGGGGSTTLFTLAVNQTGDDLTVARNGGSLSLTTSNAFSSLSGGTVTVVNNNTNSGGPDKMVCVNNSERHITFTATGSQYMAITLNTTLAQGDVIAFTSNGSAQLYITKTSTYSNSIVTASNAYTIPESSPLIGESTIYLWPVTTSAKICTFTITRSGSASCYYVTYDGNGAAGGYTNDETAYASGTTVTVATNENNHFSHPGYSFTGWNTRADGEGTGYAAGATFSISENTTLYAQWSPATLTFTGAHGADWTDPRNWTDANSVNPACVPTIDHDVILQHNATLYGPYADDNKGHGVARSVKIDKSTEELKNIKLSIWSEASLIVAKDIQAKHVGDADWGATTHHDLEIETSILGNGALITGDVSDNDVTYKFCTKAFTVYDADRGRNYYYNQYFGIPFTSTDATKQYYNCAIYEYGVETDSWITPTDGNTLHAFRAYNLLRRNITYSDNITLNGTLNLPGTDGEVLLECGWRAEDEGTTIDEEKSYQDYMFANSWTAPIVIAALDGEDCTTNLVQTIYMFNSGYQPDGEKIIGDDWGQWSAFPFKSSAYMDRAVIPATQAFLVTAKSEDATLTLKYGKHVYTPALEAGGANNYPTRAPRRTREESAPTKLKMMVMNDTVVADKLYIFEREDFTNEFDNGWDGTKMFGSSSAPQLYSQQGNGKMAVAAVPEMEGMEINFIAGTDTNKYTFKFEYADEEPLYLYDRDKLEFTRIEDGSTYTFTTDDNVAHARFMLTRSKSPWVATGVEPTNDKVVDTKVRKVLINNHIYIIRGDRVYSIEGILVK